MTTVTVCVGSSCHIKGARDVIMRFNELLTEHGLKLVATKVADGISTPSPAVALIECEPPVISNVKVSSITETSALITFQTDELAFASVDGGTSCGQSTVYGGEPMSNLLFHKIPLEFLQPGTKYYFGIQAFDLTQMNFTYDDINRVLTEDYTGDAGTEVSYGYDSCTNGTGKFCSATTSDSVVNLAYNALGLISSETKTLRST